MSRLMGGDHPQLPATVVAELSSALPSVGQLTVDALTSEVAEYRTAVVGTETALTIESSVNLALHTFLRMVTEDGDTERTARLSTTLEAAYDLGRGEARSGRTMEALLAAYRVGARVAWGELSAILVLREVGSATVARFAQLVFAYIDELSSVSAAGHRDELAASGRVREQLLVRLAEMLVAGRPAAELAEQADVAGWPIPETITAVILRAAHVAQAAQLLEPRTLRLGSHVGLPQDDLCLLLVPDAHRSRSALRSALNGRGAIVGPTRPWDQAGVSFLRACRALDIVPLDNDTVVDTEDYLVALVVTSDMEAYRDLRARALLPLATLRQPTADRLTETLRSWLVHQGRRDDVAADLHVHPQTVRYRMTQLREIFGDKLSDPQGVLELMVAVSVKL